MAIARVVDGVVIETRPINIEDVPQHKQGDWRQIAWEGDGPLAETVIEPNIVRIVKSHPTPTATDVRREAQRRIISMMGSHTLDDCIVKQLNLAMRATELVNKRASGTELTADETAEAAALQSVASAIKDIRAKSNLLEPNPPADYAADSYWT